MKHPILILLTVLAPSTAFATPPDLCAKDVYADATGDPFTDSTGTTLSRYCQWTGPDAPVWAGDACCSFDDTGAQCLAPEARGTCAEGFDLYSCKYGEEVAGGLICYQPFPSACMGENCDQPPTGPDYSPGPQEDIICCINGICYEWDDLNYEDCSGEYTWCSDGYSKLDGTVECFD